MLTLLLSQPKRGCSRPARGFNRANPEPRHRRDPNSSPNSTSLQERAACTALAQEQPQTCSGETRNICDKFVKEQVTSVHVTAQLWAYKDLFLKAFLNTLLLKNITL